MTATLVLASASPRRRDMLQRVGFMLEVRPADVDETSREGEEPKQYVTRIAAAKAAAVAASMPDAWVLAADTTVTIDGQILAKAETPDEARAMLQKLSGRVHQVWTAFAVVGPEQKKREGLVGTDVSVIAIDDALLEDYIASGEWRGKAGAYAIQGIAAALVRGVEGSVTNVIGLPLVEVIAALRDAGGPVPRFAAGSAA